MKQQINKAIIKTGRSALLEVQIEHNHKLSTLGLDKESMVDFVLALERLFSVEIFDDVWDKWRTVSDVHEYFEKIGAAAPCEGCSEGWTLYKSQGLHMSPLYHPVKCTKGE